MVDEKDELRAKVLVAVANKRNRTFVGYHMGGLSFGLLMVGIGVILLLGQMGIISTTNVFHFFWPAILIFFGLDMATSRSSFSRQTALFLILAGGVLLAGRLGYLHVGFSIIWPLALIYWGVVILAHVPRWARWGSGFRTTWPEHDESDPDHAPQPKINFTDAGMDVQSLFGSVKPSINSRNFRGGKLEAVFGEIALDLTQAEIEGDEAVIKADAVFGACEIRVPPTWDVIVRGNAVLGEFTDKTRQRLVEGTPAKRLIVRGGAVLGSVVIKN